jgi:hypothetical protein
LKLHECQLDLDRDIDDTPGLYIHCMLYGKIDRLHFCGSRCELALVRRIGWQIIKPHIYAGTNSADVCFLWSFRSAIALASRKLNLCRCRQNGSSVFEERWRMWHISAAKIVQR